MIEIGLPMQCYASNQNIQPDFLAEFCWITGTWTRQGEDLTSLQGLGHWQENSSRPKTYHRYYQWVPLILFLWSLLFALPYLLWRYVEDGTVLRISNGLQDPVS